MGRPQVISGMTHRQPRIGDRVRIRLQPDRCMLVHEKRLRIYDEWQIRQGHIDQLDTRVL